MGNPITTTMSHQKQKPMAVYEPREDSFLLAKHVQQRARGRVLDMGAGSGIQAETAMRNKQVTTVLATDIDRESLQQLHEKKIPARYSDIFSGIRPTEKFDTIMFNPPYLPATPEEDPATARQVAGGKNGNELLLRFLHGTKAHLAPKGIILCIASSLTQDVDAAIAREGYQTKVLEEESFFFETLIFLLLRYAPFPFSAK